MPPLVECRCNNCLKSGQKDYDGDPIGKFAARRVESEHRLLENVTRRSQAEQLFAHQRELDREVRSVAGRLSGLSLSDHAVQLHQPQ